jgi:N-acetylneuraminic acid mutarotase/sugar lactone lactonase YvrE
MNTQRILKVVVVVGLLAQASTSYAAEDTWTRKADMPTSRWGLCSGVVDGKIYCIGGGQQPYSNYLSTVEVYDPKTSTWTKKADMPTGRAFAWANVVNGKIYVVGGSPRNDTSTSTVEEYDPVTDTWTRKADMPTARTWFSTSVVNGKIYAISGGYTTNPAAVEEYDPATDTWTRKANMPTARELFSTSAVDGKIYVIGGVIAGAAAGPAISTVEEYDPATDTWTRKANIPTARMGVSTCVVNGKIYAIGGSPGNWAPVISTVEEYDPVTDTWATKSDMPTARLMLSTGVVDGKIYAIGGSVVYWPWTATSTVEEYDAGLTTVYVGTPEVLVQGSQLHAAHGIYFDSDDRLHICAGMGGEIVVMDRQTGEILDRYGTDVDSPDDVVIGPDGSLYWTDILTGEVGRRSPDGVVTKQFVALGVNPITLSDDGRLFTALAFLGDALYELDPELVEPPRLIAENLGMLNGFDFGPDGFLYSPLPFKGKIVRIDVDTGETTPVVAEGIMAPSVKFDSHGRLHTMNYLSGQIVRVDTQTGTMEAIASLPFGIDNLAFDSQDRLFVSESSDGMIFEILPDGTARAVNSGGMIVPGGVAVLPRPDGGESVFVADIWSLREYDGSTGELRSKEGPTRPATVSPDGENLLLTSWLLGNDVLVWNPQTREALETYTDFAFPLNAIRFQGDLVVAELGTNSVVRASAADPTQRVTLAKCLGVPAGLAATDDDLWVGDWATGVVLQIVADGELLAAPVTVATDLAHPEGLAVGPDGNLLVAETGAGRLSHIDLTCGKVTALVEGLALGLEATPATPPTHIFSGVAVSKSGTIYITSDVNNQLLAIRSVDPTLVAHWTFDETEGILASDSAGDAYGCLFGEPVWRPADGKRGGALELDGIDDYILSDYVLNPSNGPFSVFIWIKGGAAGQELICQADGTGSGETWLGMDALNANLMTGLVPPPLGRFIPEPLESQSQIADGQWHHVGFVWDGSYRYLYVDGTEVAKDTQALAQLKYSNGGLHIGTSKKRDTGTFFSGLIDDVRIYNKALSAEEIDEMVK